MKQRKKEDKNIFDRSHAKIHVCILRRAMFMPATIVGSPKEVAHKYIYRLARRQLARFTRFVSRTKYHFFYRAESINNRKTLAPNNGIILYPTVIF